MRVKVYILGSREINENRTRLYAVIKKENGSNRVQVARKYFDGYTELESKAAAAGWLLQRVSEMVSEQDEILVYFDEFFSEIRDYMNGKYKSCSDLIKDYTNYIKRLKKKVKITFNSYEKDTSEEEGKYVGKQLEVCNQNGKTIQVIQGNVFKDKEPKEVRKEENWVDKLRYSISIYKPDGTLFGYFNEKSRFDNKKHAGWFAGWYIKESEDPKSVFYKYRVDLVNLEPEFGDIYGQHEASD